MKVAVETTYNPNHRHDEKHEQEVDRIRQEICDSHRFRSFANVRSNNAAKWYSDGHDYFWALSEIIENAKECIYVGGLRAWGACLLLLHTGNLGSSPCPGDQICDWWLSPELYLRRPPALFPEYRLDRLLLRKAEQGVSVRVIVYKEVTQTMTLSSAYTKHKLEELHKNIQVFRHPDHLGGEQTFFWSHHSKIVCVDNATACIGVSGGERTQNVSGSLGL